MNISGLFRGAIDGLEKNLDLRTKKHNLIASNIANMDTPGYKRFDLIVEEEMVKINPNPNKLQMKRTHPKHIKNLTGAVDFMNPSLQGRLSQASQKDDERVDMDREMGTLAKNQLMYNVSAQVLSKKIIGLKNVIKGGK